MAGQVRAQGRERRWPIGLILCGEKNHEQIELLQLDWGEIRVAEYLVELPPKGLLEAKLHEAIRLARGRKDAQCAPGGLQEDRMLWGRGRRPGGWRRWSWECEISLDLDLLCFGLRIYGWINCICIGFKFLPILID